MSRTWTDIGQTGRTLLVAGATGMTVGATTTALGATGPGLLTFAAGAAVGVLGWSWSQSTDTPDASPSTVRATQPGRAAETTLAVIPDTTPTPTALPDLDVPGRSYGRHLPVPHDYPPWLVEQFAAGLRRHGWDPTDSLCVAAIRALAGIVPPPGWGRPIDLYAPALTTPAVTERDQAALTTGARDG